MNDIRITESPNEAAVTPEIHNLTSPSKQFGPALLLIVSQWKEPTGYMTAFRAYVDSYIDISEYIAGPMPGTTNVHIHKGRMVSSIAGPGRLHIFLDAGSEFTVSPYAPSSSIGGAA